MTEGHTIPEWYIPDEEVILANEHETEEIEENGELEEKLCPHCGEPYKREEDGRYIHYDLITEKGEWQDRYDEFGRWTGQSRVSKGKLGIWCSNGEKHRHPDIKRGFSSDYELR